MTSRNVEIPCNVEYIVRKKLPIVLDECESMVIDKDADGGYELDYDTEGVDWDVEYNNQHWSILELINELKSYVNYDLSMTGMNTRKGKYLMRILDECEGWEEVEHTITQE